MSSLFKKPKKNLRQRIATSDEEDAEGDSNQPAPTVKAESAPPASDKPPKPVKSANRPLAEVKKTTSTLSFQEDLEEDEGVETFQIRKSSQSRRIAKKMERDRKLKEQELKSKIAASATTTEKKPEEQPVENEKAWSSPTPKPLILSGREAEMAGYRSDSEEESDQEGITFRPPERVRNALESGSIPDAATIYAARKHRQQARELGGLAEYIKVDEMPDFEKESAVTSARLVREDENDKSDEEEREDGRVDFSVDLQTKDRERRKEAFLAAEQEDEREITDEEEDDWERQQFQKAIRQRQVESAHQEMILQQQYIEGSPSSSSPARELKPVRGLPSTSRLAVKSSSSKSASASVAPDLSKLAPLPDPKEVQEKLRQRLASLQEVHRRHLDDQERAQLDLTTFKEEIERLEKDRPRLSERFKYFQITRNYVQDLIDCLTTKYFEVEALEKRWFALLGRRHRYLMERRREDMRDEASDCAIQSVIVQTINPDKLARTAEREARRRRRRAGRKDAARHKEGLSSDDEVNEKETISFSTEKNKILDECNKLFADTLDEYCSLEEISRRFEEWRKREKDAYSDAYVDLFLPRLASCIVRWHLLQTGWNPLEQEVTTLNKASWFQTLAQYDLRGESENGEASASRDSNPLVISKTIEIAVLPYVVESMKAAYDPCSTSQTNRLVKLVKTLMEEHPNLSGSGTGIGTCKVIASLLAAAVEKFEVAIDQDVFIPFHFAVQNPGFVNRQFWSASKLLRNILHWQGVVDDAQLRSTGLDKLFKKCMLLPLTKTTVRGGSADPDTLDKIRYIAEALPRSWLGPLAPTASQLQPLVDATMSLAQNADSTTSAGRKHVKNVAAVLQTLGASAEAQEILVKYL